MYVLAIQKLACISNMDVMADKDVKLSARDPWKIFHTMITQLKNAFMAENIVGKEMRQNIIITSALLYLKELYLDKPTYAGLN